MSVLTIGPVYDLLGTPYGKVPLSESSVLGRGGDDVLVRAWDGQIWREPNPED